MNELKGRVMAVDPGEKRIGVAISDEMAVIANPLGVIPHISRVVDAAAVAQLAAEKGAIRIVVGQALDEEGLPGPQARKAMRFAEALRSQTTIPVVLWDESGSTRQAVAARFQMGVNRKKRSGHLDDIAATVILQSYLDFTNPTMPDDRAAGHPDGGNFDFGESNGMA